MIRTLWDMAPLVIGALVTAGFAVHSLISEARRVLRRARAR
ncbi:MULTISPECIES: hypothetical protein [Actinomycetes]|nr:MULTISPECIES: hypothetical protein [Actinomycetes]